MWRGELAEPKLVNPWIAAFVQVARLRNTGPCHMGKAIRSGVVSVQFSRGSGLSIADGCRSAIHCADLG